TGVAAYFKSKKVAFDSGRRFGSIKKHWKQVPRSPRRPAIPVKRIDGTLLIGHKHLASAPVELHQVAKAASYTNRVLHHPPEAFDGVEVMSGVGRQEMEAKRALIVRKCRVKLVRPMDPTAIDDHDDIFA